MSQPFPNHPIYQGFEAPCRAEADIFDLEIEGKIPPGLAGTFFRVSPDPQFPPRLGNDIFFNGDGMVCSFRFTDGHVDFKSRYVQTDKFRAERAARRALFGAYRNPFTDDPSVAGMIRGTANTNVVFHNGMLLALKEDSPPVAMKPDTLETIGNHRFHERLTSRTFTAHPKIDPHTGELVAFGYAAKGEATPDIAYYVIDKTGKVSHEVWFAAPHAAMIHDFAVTEHYVVFPIMPFTSDIEGLKAGRPHFTWQPGLDQFYGVLPRYGKAGDVRWFRAPNGFQGHVINAFDERGKIYVDIPVLNDNGFSFFPDASGNVPDPRTLRVRMTRWIFDVSSRSTQLESTTLTELAGDFPHIDDRYATRPYRHAFIALVDPTAPYDFQKAGPPPANAFLNGIGHIDVQTGIGKKWLPGPTASVQEPVFAPRSTTAGEGEGFVLVLVNQLAERRTDLAVLDAQHIENGPIATVRLPIRLRNGLHGNWVPASHLPVGPVSGT